jgi:NADPH:quinone reductase-like Zn-dependent oxidoreductase
MKAITIENFGDAKQIKISQVPTPMPTDNEVQIAVKDAAVNPVDWKICEGMLQSVLPHEFPIILGWDAAGVVTAVGKNVRNFKVGDQVYAYCKKPKVKWGTYAEYVCVDEKQVALKPQSLSFAEASSIPLGGLTAWQALFDIGKLKKGETVLIHGGSGGVGSIAIQLAKNTGAKVITTSSTKNHSYVKNLGADVAIDYSKENFVNRVKTECPQGVDLVIDTIGGETCKSSMNIIKSNGRLVSIVEKFDPSTQWSNNIHCFSMFVQPNGSQLQQISDLVTQGKVSAPTIQEMNLEEAASALEKNRSGHTCGKIVLKIK